MLFFKYSYLSFLFLLFIGVSSLGAKGSPPGFVVSPQNPETRFSQQGQRELAVIEGLTWMAAFLTKEKNFEDLTYDSFLIFREAALTTDSLYTRQWAETMSQVMGQRLKSYYLSFYDPVSNILCLQMLSLACEERFAEIGFAPLVEKAGLTFASFPNSEAVYGVPLTDLAALNADQLFSLLLRAYTLERVQLHYPGQFETDFHLIDVLRFLKDKPLMSYDADPNEDKAQWRDDCYLMTHIAYVLNNYGETKLYVRDVPWVYHYVRDNLPFALLEADVELVGELVDVLRGFGATENSDPLVRRGTEYLIAAQNDDGSWERTVPKKSKKKRPYDVLHPTWCAVVGLRHRFFYEGSPYHQRIQQILKELNRPHGRDLRKNVQIEEGGVLQLE